MKILLISMHSIHATRWIENLKDSGNELYWFDITGKGKLDMLQTVVQFTGWKKRKFPHIKGEYWLSKNSPALFKSIQPFLEVTANEALEKIIKEIQPDLVQSFEMQTGSYPVLKIMQKYPNLNWLYSCWGSDLFYYQQQPQHLVKIKKVLRRIQYLHTDCERDFIIAQELGFKGKFSGVIPGGGGFHLEKFLPYIQTVLERKVILIKGYQHHFGKGLTLVKAVENIQKTIQDLDFEVVVFGAHQVVIDYVVENKLPYKVFDRNGLARQDLLQLMGKSALYLGNSLSDGMPNTLLESIVMGAFPIQSNPGNVTAEIITHGKNGFLIENPMDDKSISDLILKVLGQPILIQRAFNLNQKIAKERLGYSANQQKIVALYKQIEKDIYASRL